MTPQEAILANAQMVIEKLGPVSGLETRFGYNRESVEWVEGFIERRRSQPGFKPEDEQMMIQILGSFLGECIIHTFGGEWQEKDGDWGVFFDAANGAFPFNKVHKQFHNGLDAGDSILGFFELIGTMFLDKGQPD
jgi:hypothetical protein